MHVSRIEKGEVVAPAEVEKVLDATSARKARTAGVACTRRARSSQRAALVESPSTNARSAAIANACPRRSTACTLSRSARHRRHVVAPFRLARQIGQASIAGYVSR